MVMRSFLIAVQPQFVTHSHSLIAVQPQFVTFSRQIFLCMLNFIMVFQPPRVDNPLYSNHYCTALKAHRTLRCAMKHVFFCTCARRCRKLHVLFYKSSDKAPKYMFFEKHAAIEVFFSTLSVLFKNNNLKKRLLCRRYDTRECMSKLKFLIFFFRPKFGHIERKTISINHDQCTWILRSRTPCPPS